MTDTAQAQPNRQRRFWFLVLGTIVLTPGLGFIISAAITWGLARRLGLMPNRETQN